MHYIKSTEFICIVFSSGPWFTINMSSYQYKKSLCGDKMVVRSSYLHNGFSYTGKMTSLYWIRALVVDLECKTPLAVAPSSMVWPSYEGLYLDENVIFTLQYFLIDILLIPSVSYHGEYLSNTVGCRANAVHFNRIFYTVVLQWLMQNIPRPHGRAMGCLLWDLLRKSTAF